MYDMTVFKCEQVRAIIGQFKRPFVSVLGSRSFALWLAMDKETQVRFWDPALNRVTCGPFPSNLHWMDTAETCFGNNVLTVIASDQWEIVRSMPEAFETPTRSKSIALDLLNCVPHGPWHDTHIVTLESCLCS